MAKAPYLGVVSFGRFVPDSGSVVLNEMHTPVLNEMHTNSYSGPRLINFNFDFLASEVFLKIASPINSEENSFYKHIKRVASSTFIRFKTLAFRSSFKIG